jgi:hypothetical protein
MVSGTWYRVKGRLPPSIAVVPLNGRSTRPENAVLGQGQVLRRPSAGHNQPALITNRRPQDPPQARLGKALRRDR